TEGDMLDTADLHNHPWLLELRGFRDFQTFTKQIGAREVDYIDDRSWLWRSAQGVASDAASMNFEAKHDENEKPQFEIVIQDDDMNWPIDELSRTYFEVFPGMYTYLNETGNSVSEWPYSNPDPGQSFNQCEE
ncbi:MAG: hypothetical protein HRT44_10965, partial [Bdellovibrionales bacterium]|nr:hypothetical protein [Bdellovibrionales bacterium]